VKHNKPATPLRTDRQTPERYRADTMHSSRHQNITFHAPPATPTSCCGRW